jgi:hypothetical protein
LKTVYLAHPVAPIGTYTVQNNIDHTRLVLHRLRQRYGHDYLIYAPWLASVEAYGGDSAVRRYALAQDQVLASNFQEVWAIPAPQVTEGMDMEIRMAKRVYYINEDLTRNAFEPTPWTVRLMAPDVFPMVHADLEARNAKGKAEYGDTLRGFDGRDSLRDLYEEALDKAVYIRKMMYERDLR